MIMYDNVDEVDDDDNVDDVDADVVDDDDDYYYDDDDDDDDDEVEEEEAGSLTATHTLCAPATNYFMKPGANKEQLQNAHAEE